MWKNGGIFLKPTTDSLKLRSHLFSSSANVGLDNSFETPCNPWHMSGVPRNTSIRDGSALYSKNGVKLKRQAILLAAAALFPPFREYRFSSPENLNGFRKISGSFLKSQRTARLINGPELFCNRVWLIFEIVAATSIPLFKEKEQFSTFPKISTEKSAF